MLMFVILEYTHWKEGKVIFILFCFEKYDYLEILVKKTTKTVINVIKSNFFFTILVVISATIFALSHFLHKKKVQSLFQCREYF